jgi:hypothetical protein
VHGGQPDLDFTAHWATHPFRDTWYYGGRIGLWKGKRGWLLDFTHHKLYLTNRPAEVQQFRITNGMNMLTVSRGQGHAGVPDAALHVHLGLGYQAERSAPERRPGAP